MTSTLDTVVNPTQASHMTPERPALSDLAASIANHRLAAEAASDPAAPRALAELLGQGREAAAAELGDRLLESVRALLSAAGVSEPEAQDPYLEALAESLDLRDEVTPEMPLPTEEQGDHDLDASDLGIALVGENYELPGSFLVGSTPAGSEAEAWLIPLHEHTEPVH